MAVRINLRSKAPMVATLVTALTMAGVMLPNWIRPETKLPVLTTTVPAGAPITQADIDWTEADDVQAMSGGRPGGWAAQTLEPGEVLTAAMESSTFHAGARTLVEVDPTDSADLAVEKQASQVEVLVVKSGRIIWNSGPRSIVVGPSSLLGGQGSTIGVWLSYDQAIAYETKQTQGMVSVIGIQP